MLETTLSSTPTITPPTGDGLRTLFWAVLILVGAGILGLFGHIMSGGAKKPPVRPPVVPETPSETLIE